MLSVFKIRKDLSNIKQQDCGDVTNQASQINWKIKDDNLCVGPIAPSTTDTDAADTDASAKTIARISEQEHILYLLCRIPRNDEWKNFLELMMDKNATITTTPDEIVTKLVEKPAAIKSDNGLAPGTLLIAKKGGKGINAGKSGKSPKRDTRDNKGDNNGKVKDRQKCFHCQQRGHLTENCLSKQCSDPPKSADTGAKA